MIADTLKEHIEKAALAVLGSVPEFTLEHPGDLSHGDYSTNVAMVGAKGAGKNPRQLAEEIVSELGVIEQVAKIEIAGPGFINFHLAREFFTEATKEILEAGDGWGKNETLKGQTWVIEHTSPNPNKAMHIGHLRNNVTGMALVHLTEACGANVIADAIDNNRGIAIAKLMWGYLRFAHEGGESKDLQYWYDHQDEWQIPESAGMTPDRFVDDLYVKGNSDAEASKESEAEVRRLVVAWEAGDESVRKLWQTVLDFSYLGQSRTLDRLESRWDHVWHEHEHYQQGKDFVQAGLAKGIFTELPEGGVLTDLEAYGLSDTILQKSDGTSLYITQDLALTKLKKEKYDANKLLWVVGPDQSLAMQQLFAVCEQLGIGSRTEFEHITYGYMSIKGEGKMSSRKGTVLYIDDVIDITKEVVLNNMEGRDVPDKADLAEDIALAAIKYSILRSGRLRDIAFDQEQATKIEGDSGPYLQYSHTRACSILRKAETEGVVSSFQNGTSDVPFVERLLYRFPEVVLRAQAEYEPHYVTTYLTELAGEFNSWYASTPIVVPDDSESAYRVALTEAFKITMQNGLYLLGIKAPERM